MVQTRTDWITHDGGPCPVAPDTMVEVIYRDGAGRNWPAMPAGFWSDETPELDSWMGTAAGCEPEAADIIAYRVVQS